MYAAHNTHALQYQSKIHDIRLSMLQGMSIFHGVEAAVASAPSPKSMTDAKTSIRQWSALAISHADATAEGSTRAPLLRHLLSSEASYCQEVCVPAPAMRQGPDLAPVPSLAPPVMTHPTRSAMVANALVPALQDMCTFPPECQPSYDYSTGKTIQVCINPLPEPRHWSGMC